ncbi:glycosyltransferase family 2 protein [Acinetobacter faecalis]|uniref:glycosyltransferase family 2 protein n=1 Tax=Acinetobacter faecalis TaxID=2665161 RepID=UPI002A91B603|nr:glycosyltransferase family 2 protein [Acinetobacter faecalis]MDY6459280.1 glycosyltransferase family 2 protein [Acinetobacter faecalis]
MTPILSIIIPTYNRPQLLKRAVKSCLDVMKDIDIEILIIPNGAIIHCLEHISVLSKNIYIHPISEANANIARNHGLSLARGKYVRFLDDDDYFLSCAKFQIDYMEKLNLELSVGYTRHGIDGKLLNRVTLPIDLKDIVECVLSQSGFTLVTGNLFLRESLKEVCWRPEILRLQDNIWMIDLCMAREWRWAIYDEDVAVWYHHNSNRISRNIKNNCIAPWFFYSKLELWYTLHRQNRLTKVRSDKIVENLKDYIHLNFPTAPLTCHKMTLDMIYLKKYQKNSCRLEYIILLREWIMLPYRKFKHYIFDILDKRKNKISIKNGF